MALWHIVGQLLCVCCSGLTSFSTMFQSFHDGQTIEATLNIKHCIIMHFPQENVKGEYKGDYTKLDLHVLTG